MSKLLLTHPIDSAAERLDGDWGPLDTAAMLNLKLAATLWELKIPIEVEREALKLLANWILASQRRVENGN